MKKSLFFKFFLFTVIATMVTFTACKDYDDDIDHLQDQITSLKATVDKIDAAVAAGAVITNVSPTADGIKVTLSDGKSFNLANGKDGKDGTNGTNGTDGKDGVDGTNGTNGTNGKDGSVITIGENGNWFIDGVDSDLAARGPQGETGAPGKDGTNGTDGEAGAPGKDGEDGTDGKDGAYYYPNEDGFWYMVEGETETKTEQTWLPAGTLTAVWADGVLTLYNVEGMEDGYVIGAMTLNNLVLIPDYVFKDGATGIALFNQLNSDECGMISAPTTLRYRVSPTNATEDMIDTENIRIEFNAPTIVSRAEEAPKFTAEFVSLKDGVLTVKAHMAKDALEDLDEGKLPQIQLIVPTTPNEEVISDWVSVQTEEISNLYIANSQFEADRDEDFVWSKYKLPVTLEAAKALDVEEALSVVEVQYNQAFDLIDVVNTLFDTDKELNLEDYGLSYSFDLKYTDGEEDKDIEYPLTVNETDQQDFINLSDEAKGTVKSKVYTNENSRTAIGRTPIVRVQLMNDDCVVETAYIKINWVEEAKEPVPALELELDATAAFVCEAAIDNVLKGVVDVDWMNVEVYDHFDMTKPEFHDAYEISGVKAYNADGDPLGWPGTAYDLPDDGSEATHLVRWKFNPSDNSMTPETNVVTGHINYVEKGTNKVAVTIEVTLTITFPEFSLYGHNSTYWNADRSVFTVNPLVYGTEQADDTVDIYTSLLDGFRNKDKSTPIDEFDLIKSTVEGVAPEAVKFVFDEKALKDANYTIFIDGVEFSFDKGNLGLAPNKSTLYAGNLIAAIIEGNTIKLGTDGKESNDASKQLVGKTLPVKLVADLCGDNKVLSTVKDFDVYFIDPLKINADFKDAFEDAVPNGSVISIAEALTLTDWNGYTVREAEFTDAEKPTVKQKIAHLLYPYYGIGDTKWGLAEATTNMKEDANGDLVPVEGYTEGILSSSYSIEVNTDGNLVFENSGSKLIEPFVIYIPVTISHKWGEVSAQVAITVNPTQE